ncbi:hypothetical protein F6X40_22245 [Paraburkholderia sp. UCT31]|uniref:hypothetical protein n=1 Tax=Paraburkholderia sp. UCT31 TaxID=2615209 RepID=UPI00165508DD|nr:hypothetical protein [Paraburkholderia sp. UCT31]MBC8739460.1 hypothetical protein [Paraburkholderia sp. UCT31]
MTLPGNLDEVARAELLCYLVASQIIWRRYTDKWMPSDHLIDSARIWLDANGGACDWLERAELGEASLTLASMFHSERVMPTQIDLARLFTDGGRLDYRNSSTRILHTLCVEHLRSRAHRRKD